MRRRLCTLTLGITATLVSTMPLATAGTVEPPPSASLRLIVDDGTATRHADLTCEPTGGDHPAAARACADIAAADGDVAAVQSPDTSLCPAVHQPVTVRAVGRWHTEPVHYQETFSNTCVLHGQKRAVFRF